MVEGGGIAPNSGFEEKGEVVSQPRMIGHTAGEMGRKGVMGEREGSQIGERRDSHPQKRWTPWRMGNVMGKGDL